MDIDKYVGRQEAATIMQVSVRTIDRWLKGGTLPFIWYRTLVMIERKSLANMKRPSRKKSLTSAS